MTDSSGVLHFRKSASDSRVRQRRLNLTFIDNTLETNADKKSLLQNSFIRLNIIFFFFTMFLNKCDITISLNKQRKIVGFPV